MGTRLDINVVVSNGYIGDNLEIWALGKDHLINPIREQNDRTCLLLKPLYKGIKRKWNVALIIINFKMVPDKGDNLVEYLTGNQNLCPHDIFSLCQKKRGRTIKNSSPFLLSFDLRDYPLEIQDLSPSVFRLSTLLRTETFQDLNKLQSFCLRVSPGVPELPLRRPSLLLRGLSCN
jgi:hypothetical protein